LTEVAVLLIGVDAVIDRVVDTSAGVTPTREGSGVFVDRDPNAFEGDGDCWGGVG
jgi:hypothetical protein